MGYLHDTHTSLFVPPTICHYTVGTWSDAAGAVGHTICKSKAAANDTSLVTIPLRIPQNSSDRKGAYLKSIDLWWKNSTSDLDALSASIYKSTLPANTVAFSVLTSQDFTYDTGHDAAGKRITQAEHKMTLTITTPFWLDDDDLVTVEFTVDAKIGSAFVIFGARANFTWRL